MEKIKLEFEIDATLWKRVDKAYADYEGVSVTEYVELALLKQVLSDERHQDKLSKD